MAALMPDAESALSLAKEGDTLVTTLGGKPATTPTTRFAHLVSRKGDQCADCELEELVKAKKPATTGGASEHDGGKSCKRGLRPRQRRSCKRG